MKSLPVSIAAIVAVGIVVVLIEDPTSPFAYWNLVPVGLALLAVLRKSVGVFGLTFAAAASAVELFFHLALEFDWWEMATASSTSSLIVIFVPIIALCMSVVVAGLGLVIDNQVRKRYSFRTKPGGVIFASAFLGSFLVLLIFSALTYSPQK